MKNLMLKLWNDDAGALIATEWVFVVTILVIGLVVGLKSVQKAVVNELVDTANAVGALSQTYHFGGTRGCDGSETHGSRFSDARSTYSVNTHTNDFDERTNSCGD
jgi:hypothetical protein